MPLGVGPSRLAWHRDDAPRDVDDDEGVERISRQPVKQKPTRRSESRRQEARRRLSEQRGTLWQNVVRRMSPLSLLIWIGFYVAVVGILLIGGESMPWRLNERVTTDITARVPFEIEDAVRTQQERQAAASSAPDIYVRNPAPLASLRGKLTQLLAMAKASAGDYAKFQAQAESKGWRIAEDAYKTLHTFATSDEQSSAYEAMVNRFVNELGWTYIVEKPDQPVREETPRTAILRTTGDEDVQDIEVLTSQLQYISVVGPVRQIVDDLVTRTFPEGLHDPIVSLAESTLLERQEDGTFTPLWRYDPSATTESMRLARENVPRYTIRKEAGDLLVRARSVLSSRELDLLATEHQQYLRAEMTDPALRTRKMLYQLGTAVTVLLIMVGLVVYTTIYQDRILRKPTRTLGLAGLLTAMILLSRLLVQVEYPSHPPSEFCVGFVVMAAMLLTIAYNQRFAFGAGGTLALLVTLTCQGDFGLFLTLLVGMGVAVFTLKEIRTRSKVIAVGAMAGMGAFAAAFSSSLIADQELKYAIAHSLAAGGATLFAGFIVQGILPNFERLFGIATSMTLLEWCDASRPLLRRLAQEAPGTYSHSLILSQMSEEAASVIGANGLLARVGALYHDIGKLQKSEYFVENQEARMNRHDRLAPTMSLLIITGHVKDGLEMAKAYSLPRTLHQFILEHHGTTVVKYFHHAANEAAARNTTGKHDRGVSENEFRYPGPKPRSRESAILMLCDGCEGAVRALTEPTPGRIESTVHQVAMDRLIDGQFDECDITLRDLYIVEQSIVKSLGAIHHGRVKYPKGGSRSDAAEQDRKNTKSGKDDKAPSESGDRNESTEGAPSTQDAQRTPEVARQA